MCEKIASYNVLKYMIDLGNITALLSFNYFTWIYNNRENNFRSPKIRLFFLLTLHIYHNNLL